MRRVANPQRAGAEPHRVGVMKDQDLVVGRQPQITFDPGAQLKRGCEREQAVFGKSGPVMEPAVRESRRPGI